MNTATAMAAAMAPKKAWSHRRPETTLPMTFPFVHPRAPSVVQMGCELCECGLQVVAKDYANTRFWTSRRLSDRYGLFTQAAICFVFCLRQGL
jgi:hypothetical protein